MSYELKGTPGPWWIGKQGEINECFTEVSAKNHHALCSVVTQMDEYDPDLKVYRDKKNELEANAQLIAAAPELFEALNELLSYTRACQTLLNASESGQCIKARAALAKATGGEG